MNDVISTVEQHDVQKGKLPQKFIEQAAARYIESLREKYAFFLSSKSVGLGSPIEVLFLSALHEMSSDYGDIYTACGANGASRNGGVVYEPPIGNYMFFVEPQRQIGRYRVDFVVGMMPEVPEVRVVVECDGHDFHQKTKEQAAKDKKRDRDLLMMGYKVMRFTGSEVYNDALGCARDVFDFLVRQEFAQNNGAE